MSNYSDSAFKLDDSNNSWSKTFNLIPPGSTVLDVGCSSGTFGAELVKQKQCVVDGIEIDEDDYRAAKKRLRKVYQLDIERDDISLEDTYDIVFLGDVIEHLARPIPTLAKLKNVINKNGKLVFSMPNITHMTVRFMLMEGKIEYGRTGLLDETHLHFYNSQEIYRVLNAAGYKIEVFDYTVNDVPFELATEKLNKIGLEPKPEFRELLKSTDAAAYQFIGIASKTSAAKPQPLPDSSPSNIVDDYITELKNQYEKAIHDLQANMHAIAEDRDRIIGDRDRIKLENERLNRDLEIVRSPIKKAAYFTGRAARKAKSKLGGRGPQAS